MLRLRIALCLLALASLAEVALGGEFTIEGAKIALDVPAGWQAAPGLLGMPFAVLGEEDSGGRPVLAVVPTGLDGVKFDEKKLASTQADYEAGRREWLDERGGEALEFFPYKKFKNKAGIEVHSIGYRYDLSGIEFKEVSYFMNCRGQLFQLQALLRSAQKASAQSAIDAMVGSFHCD